MRILDTSPITGTVRMPVKKGTLNFLQQAYGETLAATLINIIGASYDASKVYILYGCVATSPGGVINISAGAVFTNGEIFLSPAQVFTEEPFPAVIVAYVLTTPYTVNADPVTFTDSSTHNVHNIRTAAFVYGTSGTGTLNGGASANNDFENFVNLINTGAFITTGITYGTGCSDGGAGGTGQYSPSYEIKDGKVTLAGCINLAAISTTQTILTLPSIARPAKNCYPPYPVSTITGVVNFIIKTDGTILLGSDGGTGIISLDGITYRLS